MEPLFGVIDRLRCSRGADCRFRNEERTEMLQTLREITTQVVILEQTRPKAIVPGVLRPVHHLGHAMLMIDPRNGVFTDSKVENAYHHLLALARRIC